MADWLQKKCQTCIGMTGIIERNDAVAYLQQMQSWKLDETSTTIVRHFEFKNFKQTMFFINAIAFLCEKEGHHPDVKFGYNYCDISLTTHALGGLSENDFIIASKIDQLLA
jgi:4a-hydroxytetrahydrobiopterin dehydratase